MPARWLKNDEAESSQRRAPNMRSNNRVGKEPLQVRALTKRKSKGKSGSGGGSSPSTTHKSTSGGTTSRSGFTIPGLTSKRSATPFSDGGGSIIKIPSGSTFAGRDAGGGTRDQVYGSSRYGSGYPYGGYGSYVSGRGFPFGFWPMYWGPHYYGGSEYGPERNESRPGGNLTTTRIESTFWHNVSSLLSSRDTTPTEPIHAFHLIGDEDSVRAVLDVLVTSDCDVANLTIVPFDLTNTSQPSPESVVQYYRSSSFALTLDGYNNTAESLGNMPSSNSSAPPNIPDTPIPTNSTDFSFLTCINNTISEALPIMDGGAFSKFGSVPNFQMGSLLGLLWLTWFMLRRHA
ncbi:hypothetical protein DL93DRAFT_2166006 [Clavulina sp. PMI_390]|nr:hypothetical protein DL93DRAFT_2166006 [Clavulina sp. PMI_390]